MAGEGHREAQFSQGCVLVTQADGNKDDDEIYIGLGTSGRSPMADVGLKGWHIAPKRFWSLTTPKFIHVLT